MEKKLSCLVVAMGLLLSPGAALAGDWNGDWGEWGGDNGAWGDRHWHGGGRQGRIWGGRRAWDGGYGWRGHGYYAPPYGWSGGHGGACWRWWYGRWTWVC